MAVQPEGALTHGQRVGDYVVEGELGDGGMARVYRVRHAVLDTTHALKVLAPQYRAMPEARQRFLDEARIQAKHLDHPNIVKVTNVVVSDEVAALVMELIDGPSLEDYIARLGRTSSADEVRELVLPILAAVDHAHEQGIIHRDIKPANILLARSRDGRWIPKVTDFGIAKVTQDLGHGRAVAKKSTQAATRMGTLSYMSPEQIRSAKDVGPQSDIFSLGALLYEIATGTVAFDGDSEYDVMDKIVKGEYEPPARRLQGIDPGLAAAIAAALQPEAAQRPASCGALAAMLAEPAGGSERKLREELLTRAAVLEAVAPTDPLMAPLPAVVSPTHGVPALLSLFFAGFGQLVKGHVFKAFAIWGTLFGLAVTGPFVGVAFALMPVVWIWNIYDAYKSDDKRIFKRA